MQEKGKRLIRDLRRHVVHVMSGLAECRPGGSGASQAFIEDQSGIKVDLPKQRRWVIWTLLHSLQQDGSAENIGSPGRPLWRLTREGERGLS